MDEAIAACVENPLRRVLPSLPGPFDVAASTCLLSQLIGCVVPDGGGDALRFVAALQAIRAGHLRWLPPTSPPLGASPSDYRRPFFRHVPVPGRRRRVAVPATLSFPSWPVANLFHGVNPAVIASFLQADPLSPPRSRPSSAGPWLWDFGPRVYLVVAWIVHKRSAPVSHGFAVQESPEGTDCGRPAVLMKNGRALEFRINDVTVPGFLFVVPLRRPI